MALVDTARRLIVKHGRAVTLVRRTDSPGDAAAPWDAGESLTRTPLSMVFINEKHQQQSGGNTERGTKEAFASGLDAVNIETGDRIEDGAVVWQVNDANPIQPGATLYVWKLVLAR